MKNLLKFALILMFTYNINAQVSPQSKKQLDVKENFIGEYNSKISDLGLSTVVKMGLKKRATSKLKKFGFNNITIINVGKVNSPRSIASKMGGTLLASGAGEAQLSNAKTSGEINRAVDKIYSDYSSIDWKFQINFKDSEGNLFKVRLSKSSYAPKYIIKESDDIVKL